MILLNANSVEGAEITILEGLSRTISNYINPPYLLLITSGILYAMLTVRKAKFTSNWLCRNFSTALVALYPFCHMLASTHAYYHYFFVYREFVITILAVFFLILDAENLKLEKSPV